MGSMETGRMNEIKKPMTRFKHTELGGSPGCERIETNPYNNQRYSSIESSSTPL